MKTGAGAADTDGGEPENPLDARAAYAKRFGDIPIWLWQLSDLDALHILGVALRVGMPLTLVDHHLREDALRPDLPLPRGRRRRK